MWIDIKDFMLISQEQFNNLIMHYGVNLDITSEMYLFTYLFTNLFAYILILILLYLIYRFVHKLMPRDRRKYWC